jgi:hypothetical protein
MDSIRFLALLLLGPLLAVSATVPLNDKNWKAISGSAALDPAIRHDQHISAKLQPGEAGMATKIELASVTLVPGKNYVLTGWVRTADVAI